MWNPTSFGANQEAFITLASINHNPSGVEIDLLLKSQSTTSYTDGVLEVLYDPVGDTVQVWTYTNAQLWVQHGASIPVVFANGDQFGARAYASGQVQVYRNGVLLGTRDITSWPLYANTGYLGLWMINSSTTRLDDFGGGTVP